MKVFFAFVIILLGICIQSIDTPNAPQADKKIQFVYEVQQQKSTVINQGNNGAKVYIVQTQQKPTKIQQDKIVMEAQALKKNQSVVTNINSNENHTNSQKKSEVIIIEPKKEQSPNKTEIVPPTKVENPTEIVQNNEKQIPITNEQALKQQEYIQQVIQEDNKLILEPEQQSQQKVIEEQERQIQKQQEKELVNELQQWIELERQQYKNVPNFNGTLQRFSFLVYSDQFQSFSIDATKLKAGKSIYIQVEVFIDFQDTFTVPNNPAEGTYLGFSITDKKMTKTNRNYLRAGVKKNVYLAYKRYYTPIRPNIFYLNFENYYTQKLFLVVSVQVQKNQVQPFNSTVIDPFTKSLQGVIEQMNTQGEKRRLSYKSQWGFKELEDKRQSTMLILTGIQLMAILATAFVQMFCLRNLLDSRSIV